MSFFKTSFFLNFYFALFKFYYFIFLMYLYLTFFFYFFTFSSNFLTHVLYFAITSLIFPYYLPKFLLSLILLFINIYLLAQLIYHFLHQFHQSVIFLSFLSFLCINNLNIKKISLNFNFYILPHIWPHLI